MAKKNYNHGMNNFKIEQLEPRQMFSAVVGLNDIEQQLENIPDIVENTLESIDNLQMSNLGLDALAAELNNRITIDLPQSFVNPSFSVQNEDTLKLNLGYQSNADVGNLNIDTVALQTNNVTISASVLANVSVELDFDKDDDEVPAESRDSYNNLFKCVQNSFGKRILYNCC